MVQDAYASNSSPIIFSMAQQKKRRRRKDSRSSSSSSNSSDSGKRKSRNRKKDSSANRNSDNGDTKSKSRNAKRDRYSSGSSHSGDTKRKSRNHKKDRSANRSSEYGDTKSNSRNRRRDRSSDSSDSGDKRKSRHRKKDSSANKDSDNGDTKSKSRIRARDRSSDSSDSGDTKRKSRNHKKDRSANRSSEYGDTKSNSRNRKRDTSSGSSDSDDTKCKSRNRKNDSSANINNHSGDRLRRSRKRKKENSSRSPSRSSDNCGAKSKPRNRKRDSSSGSSDSDDTKCKSRNRKKDSSANINNHSGDRLRRSRKRKRDNSSRSSSRSSDNRDTKSKPRKRKRDSSSCRSSSSSDSGGRSKRRWTKRYKKGRSSSHPRRKSRSTKSPKDRSMSSCSDSDAQHSRVGQSDTTNWKGLSADQPLDLEHLQKQNVPVTELNYSRASASPAQLYQDFKRPGLGLKHGQDSMQQNKGVTGLNYSRTSPSPVSQQYQNFHQHQGPGIKYERQDCADCPESMQENKAVTGLNYSRTSPVSQLCKENFRHPGPGPVQKHETQPGQNMHNVPVSELNYYGMLQSHTPQHYRHPGPGLNYSTQQLMNMQNVAFTGLNYGGVPPSLLHPGVGLNVNMQTLAGLQAQQNFLNVSHPEMKLPQKPSSAGATRQPLSTLDTALDATDDPMFQKLMCGDRKTKIDIYTESNISTSSSDGDRSSPLQQLEKEMSEEVSGAAQWPTTEANVHESGKDVTKDADGASEILLETLEEREAKEACKKEPAAHVTEKTITKKAKGPARKQKVTKNPEGALARESEVSKTAEGTGSTIIAGKCESVESNDLKTKFFKLLKDSDNEESKEKDVESIKPASKPPRKARAPAKRKKVAKDSGSTNCTSQNDGINDGHSDLLSNEVGANSKGTKPDGKRTSNKKNIKANDEENGSTKAATPPGRKRKQTFEQEIPEKKVKADVTQDDSKKGNCTSTTVAADLLDSQINNNETLPEISMDQNKTFDASSVVEDFDNTSPAASSSPVPKTIPTVKCTLCDFESNLVNVEQHVATEHMSIIYQCHLCQFSCRDQEKIQEHLADHKRPQGSDDHPIRKVFDKLKAPNKASMQEINDCKSITQAKFRSLLKQCKLSEVIVPGNGYCFSSSVIAALEEKNIYKDHYVLSALVMDEITNNKGFYMKFCIPPLPEQEFIGLCAAFWQHRDYTKQVADICVSALANAVGVNLNVIELIGKKVHLSKIDCSRTRKSDINIFLRYYKNSGDPNNFVASHYNVYLEENYVKEQKAYIESRFVKDDDDCDGATIPPRTRSQAQLANTTRSSTGNGTSQAKIGNSKMPDGFTTVRVRTDEYLSYFKQSPFFAIEEDDSSLPPILRLTSEWSSAFHAVTAERDSSCVSNATINSDDSLLKVEKKVHEYTRGADRGKEVPTPSGRYLVYQEGDDGSALTGLAKKRYLGAMRARRRRARLKLKLEQSMLANPGTDNEANDTVGPRPEPRCNRRNRQERYRLKLKKKKLERDRRRRNRQMNKMRQEATPMNQSKLKLGVSNSSLYETPLQCKKQIRQRTFDCISKMPKANTEVRCAVAHRIVKKLINSPSTSATMKRIIDHHCSFSTKSKKSKYPLPKLEASFLNRMLLKIKKYKSTKQAEKHTKCVNDVKQKYSIRSLAKHFDMHYSQMHRLMSWKSEHGRALSDSNKDKVLQFYSKSVVSQQLPYKRYAKYYYLRTPLAVAYELYAEKQRKLGFRVLSRSSVYRCLRGKFRVRKKIPFKDCQCDICLNVSLLIDALVAYKVLGIRRRITQNVLMSLCDLKNMNDKDGDPENEVVLTDHNRDCIFRKCKNCGGVKLQEEIVKKNPNVDWGRIVTWHRWEHVKQPEVVDEETKEKGTKKYFDKIRYHGTLGQLLSLFNKAVLDLSTHLFHFRWQALQFDECKQQLQSGDVLMVMDFAQNYAHHRQDEVHGAFWTRRQSTLHPIVIYYVCPENCGYLVRNEVMMLSSDLKHDGFAVDAFVDKALEHLNKNHVPVKRIVMYSDNCGPQYKCCKVFDSISKVTIPLMRSYFCSHHGKSDGDGAIGRLSMHLDAVVRSGTREFSNSTEIADYCKAHLTVEKSKDDIDDGKCMHFRRHYYEVNDIVRGDTSDAKTVQGTMTFHCVRNTGHDGIIEVRESACFCDTCFLNAAGECKNKRLVEPFAWASVRKRNNESKKVPLKLNNTIWGSYSCPYRPTRKRIKLVQSHVSKKQKPNVTNVRNVKCKRLIDESVSDSDDTDFEDNIPLSDLATTLDVVSTDTPVSFRTRQRLYEKEWVRCERDRQHYDLDDLETTAKLKKVKVKFEKKSESEQEKMKDELNVSLTGIEPFSPNLLKSQKLPSKREITNSNTAKNILTRNDHMNLEEREQSVITSTPKSCTKLADNECISIVCSPVHCLTANKVHEMTNDDAKFSWSRFYKKIISCSTFKSLQKICHEIVIPPLPDALFGDKTAFLDKRDKLAMTYIPDDIPSRFRLHDPIQISPDGNCHFRSLSRLAYGSEQNHLEIRCRIVLDSVLNFNNYTDNEYLMRGARHVHRRCSHIGEYYCIYSGVKNIGDRDQTIDGIKSVFREDIMRIRHNFEWADIWQMQSAANVLNSKLFVIFPQKNIRQDTRVDFNRVFLPQNSESPNLNAFGIMWSNLIASSPKYNHIVPLIQRQSPQVVLNRLAKTRGKKKDKSATKYNSDEGGNSSQLRGARKKVISESEVKKRSNGDGKKGKKTRGGKSKQIDGSSSDQAGISAVKLENNNVIKNEEVQTENVEPTEVTESSSSMGNLFQAQTKSKRLKYEDLKQKVDKDRMKNLNKRLDEIPSKDNDGGHSMVTRRGPFPLVLKSKDTDSTDVGDDWNQSNDADSTQPVDSKTSEDQSEENRDSNGDGGTLGTTTQESNGEINKVLDSCGDADSTQPVDSKTSEDQSEENGDSNGDGGTLGTTTQESNGEVNKVVDSWGDKTDSVNTSQPSGYLELEEGKGKSANDERDTNSQHDEVGSCADKTDSVNTSQPNAGSDYLEIEQGKGKSANDERVADSELDLTPEFSEDDDLPLSTWRMNDDDIPLSKLTKLSKFEVRNNVKDNPNVDKNENSDSSTLSIPGETLKTNIGTIIDDLDDEEEDAPLSNEGYRLRHPEQSGILATQGSYLYCTEDKRDLDTDDDDTTLATNSATDQPICTLLQVSNTIGESCNGDTEAETSQSSDVVGQNSELSLSGFPTETSQSHQSIQSVPTSPSYYIKDRLLSEAIFDVNITVPSSSSTPLTGELRAESASVAIDERKVTFASSSPSVTAESPPESALVAIDDGTPESALVAIDDGKVTCASSSPSVAAELPPECASVAIDDGKVTCASPSPSVTAELPPESSSVAIDDGKVTCASPSPSVTAELPPESASVAIDDGKDTFGSSSPSVTAELPPESASVAIDDGKVTCASPSPSVTAELPPESASVAIDDGKVTCASPSPSVIAELPPESASVAIDDGKVTCASPSPSVTAELPPESASVAIDDGKDTFGSSSPSVTAELPPESASVAIDDGKVTCASPSPSVTAELPPESASVVIDEVKVTFGSSSPSVTAELPPESASVVIDEVKVTAESPPESASVAIDEVKVTFGSSSPSVTAESPPESASVAIADGEATDLLPSLPSSTGNTNTVTCASSLTPVICEVSPTVPSSSSSCCIVEARKESISSAIAEVNTMGTSSSPSSTGKTPNKIEVNSVTISAVNITDGPPSSPPSNNEGKPCASPPPGIASKTNCNISEPSSNQAEDLTSQSDTTHNTNASDEEYSSPYEHVITREKTRTKKKTKKKAKNSNDNDGNAKSFWYSAACYGFPRRKLCPDFYKKKCINQQWPGLSIKAAGRNEGKGVFATECFKRGTVICNYGGVEVSEEYAESKLLPFEHKCDYLVEMCEQYKGSIKKFFLNHDDESENKLGLTYGKFLNHSKLHPNLHAKVVVKGENSLDILFLAKHKILVNDQLVWDYGDNYSGVRPCVQSCKICGDNNLLSARRVQKVTDDA